MSLKCGIVGLPNVGKSTLFNALTKAGIAAENYPFCTIEPNVGIVEVPDLRLDVIAGIADEYFEIARPCRMPDVVNARAEAAMSVRIGSNQRSDHPSVRNLRPDRRAVFAIAGDIEHRTPLAL